MDISDDGVGLDPYTQILNTADALIPIMYRDDIDGSWVEDKPTTLPYKNNGDDTNLNYNLDDGDGTFSQSALANGKFVSYTLIATNDRVNSVKMVQGQTSYNSQVDAAQGAETEIVNFGEFPSTEIILLYRFVMQTGNYTGVKNAQIVEVIDFRSSTLLGSGAVATSHSSLSNLNADDHSQYALLAGRIGGQTLYGSDTTAETLVLKNNSIDDDVSITIGTQVGVAGVLDVSGLGTVLTISMDGDAGGAASTNRITGATDTPTSGYNWDGTGSAPNGYIKGYVGTQAVVIPYWNT
jgi:hypothetical protein